MSCDQDKKPKLGDLACRQNASRQSEAGQALSSKKSIMFCLILFFGLSFCSQEKLMSLNQNISVMSSVAPAPRVKRSRWKSQPSLRNSLVVPVPTQTTKLLKYTSCTIRRKQDPAQRSVTHKLNRSLSAVAWCSPSPPLRFTNTDSSLNKPWWPGAA